MSKFCKEEEEKSGMKMDGPHLKLETHTHGFKLCYQSKCYEVTCDKPSTLEEILKNHFYYRAICKRNQNQKVPVLLVHRERIPKVAVSLSSPCCLIEASEVLKITFIKSEKNSSAPMALTDLSLVTTPEKLLSFYIKTKGDKNIRKLMRNNDLCKVLDYVCVYAVKGETMKAALKRDGRFKKTIFKKGELSEEGTGIITAMTMLVDLLDGKQFQIKISQYQTASQESSQEDETLTNGSHEVPQSEKTSHASTGAQQRNTETQLKEKKPRKYPDVQPISNSEEILKLLREQFKDLLNTLKERENLRNKSDLQKFFRLEFDKSVDSFSEVKRVKQLMVLSDSVCQIKVNDSQIGTGFLLFLRFIVTNAHVIEKYYDLDKKELNRPITAVFGYENTGTGHEVRVKQVAVYFKGKDEMGNHLDFALLELDPDLSNVQLPVPELLSYYSPPPSGGAICIIGHPGGDVKKLDYSFIIQKEEVMTEINDHIEKNPDYFLIIKQQDKREQWEVKVSQISYNTCFFHGSSGSPVFDEFCRLIGVHTGGYAYKGKGEKTRSLVEYALPMTPILLQIFKLCYLENQQEILQYFQSQENMVFLLNKATQLASE